MMTAHAASILICTYGDEDWVDLAYSRAYPSALAQGALEVVVHHDPGGTLADSRNQAAADAEGEWLCFLDADDELADDYLEFMAEAWMLGAITDDWSPLLVPAVSYVNPQGKAMPPRVLNDGRPLGEVNRAVIGTLVRRSLFLELGGFRDLPALEDWALWMACERAGSRLVDVPAAVYRVWARPMSRNSDQSLYHQLRAEHIAAGGSA